MVEMKSLFGIAFFAVMLVMLASNFVTSEGSFKFPTEVSPQPFYSMATVFLAVMGGLVLFNKVSQEKVTKKDIFIIVLVCGEERFKKKVKKARIFKSIKALLKIYPLKKIMPGLTTEKEWRQELYNYPDYKEKIQKHGIVALELNGK